MPIFTRTVEYGTPFRKNEVVRATCDLPGVPAGTTGKIKLANGFEWHRYWVFFDNGIDVGQLDERELVRPEHWGQWHEQQAEEAAAAERLAASAASSADDAGGDRAAAGDADPDDPLARLRAMVPAHLLEKSKAARERLTGA